MNRLAIHTITTKAWDLPTAAAKYSAAGVHGMGVWRQWLEGRPLEESRRILDDHGITPDVVGDDADHEGSRETEPDPCRPPRPPP